MKNKFPSKDKQFQECTIKDVTKYDSGYEIQRSDGWSFFIEKNTPIEPKKGMSARFYGPGIGSVVRGLFLDGKKVFYRTEKEQEKYNDEQLYGKDIKEWLSRWDSGKSVFSIEMGGMGPGYEQCIQVLCVEIIRKLIEVSVDWWSGTDSENDAVFAEVQEIMDKVVTRLDEHFGFSGAQVGAAKNLASIMYRQGPIRVMNDDRVKDRHIQVCKSIPQVPS